MITRGRLSLSFRRVNFTLFKRGHPMIRSLVNLISASIVSIEKIYSSFSYKSLVFIVLLCKRARVSALAIFYISI